MQINQDIYEKMDAVNQAAFITHEAFYKWLRDSQNETSSLRVRRAVGLAFSDPNYHFGVITNNLPNEYYACTSVPQATALPGDLTYDSMFYIFPQKYPIPGKSIAASVRLIKLAGMSMIGNAVDVEFAVVAQPLDQFSDLHSLACNTISIDLRFAGMVQPELNAWVRIDKAGPNGYLEASIGAKPSIFHPAGVAWQKTACVYHSANQRGRK